MTTENEKKVRSILKQMIMDLNEKYTALEEAGVFERGEYWRLRDDDFVVEGHKEEEVKQ